MSTRKTVRTAIPASIRRQVLVEAGHQCAIQTCRSGADIDVHHIVPWAKSRNHDPANLVALCPNCHRRADRKEIDRQSLRQYKLICQALTRKPERHSEPKTYIKFSPHSPTTILEAENITSLVDIGVLKVGVGFAAPFKDANYVVSASGNGSVAFRVMHQTEHAIQMVFDEPCPAIVRLQFAE